MSVIPSLTIFPEEQKFNGDNLLQWNTNMTQLLGAKGLLGYIDGKIMKPAQPPTSDTLSATATGTPIYSTTPTPDEWTYRDQVARGHITLNCTDVTSLGVITTGTAKDAYDSIQNEWGKSTDMRRSHAQDALNRTEYAEGTDIIDHIKLLRTRKAAVDNLTSSMMSDETWRGIIIRSIPPTANWLPVIPSLYTMTTSANIISTLSAHGMIIGRHTDATTIGVTSSNTALAAQTTNLDLKECTNPDCKAKVRSTHTTTNCYWPGGGKEGQFPPDFGTRSRPSIATSNPEQTRHFALSARVYQWDTPGHSGVLIDTPTHSTYPSNLQVPLASLLLVPTSTNKTSPANASLVANHFTKSDSDNAAINDRHHINHKLDITDISGARHHRQIRRQSTSHRISASVGERDELSTPFIVTELERVEPITVPTRRTLSPTPLTNTSISGFNLKLLGLGNTITTGTSTIINNHHNIHWQHRRVTRSNDDQPAIPIIPDKFPVGRHDRSSHWQDHHDQVINNKPDSESDNVNAVHLNLGKPDHQAELSGSEGHPPCISATVGEKTTPSGDPTTILLVDTTPPAAMTRNTTINNHHHINRRHVNQLNDNQPTISQASRIPADRHHDTGHHGHNQLEVIDIKLGTVTVNIAIIPITTVITVKSQKAGLRCQSTESEQHEPTGKGEGQPGQDWATDLKLPQTNFESIIDWPSMNYYVIIAIYTEPAENNNNGYPNHLPSLTIPSPPLTTTLLPTFHWQPLDRDRDSTDMKGHWHDNKVQRLGAKRCGGDTGRVVDFREKEGTSTQSCAAAPTCQRWQCLASTVTTGTTSGIIYKYHRDYNTFSDFSMHIATTSRLHHDSSTYSLISWQSRLGHLPLLVLARHLPSPLRLYYYYNLLLLRVTNESHRGHRDRNHATQRSPPHFIHSHSRSNVVTYSMPGIPFSRLYIIDWNVQLEPSSLFHTLFDILRPTILFISIKPLHYAHHHISIISLTNSTYFIATTSILLNTTVTTYYYSSSSSNYRDTATSGTEITTIMLFLVTHARLILNIKVQDKALLPFMGEYWNMPGTGLKFTYVDRFTGRCRADGTADLPFDGIRHVTLARARALPPSPLRAKKLGCHLDKIK